MLTRNEKSSNCKEPLKKKKKERAKSTQTKQKEEVIRVEMIGK